MVSCNNFNGQIFLSRISVPYSKICSGTLFKTNSLLPQKIAPENFGCNTFLDPLWNEEDDCWGCDGAIWNLESYNWDSIADTWNEDCNYCNDTFIWDETQNNWNTNENVWESGGENNVVSYPWDQANLNPDCFRVRNFTYEYPRLKPDIDICINNDETFTRIRCLNRFGWGEFQNDADGEILLMYHESCVGYQKSGPGETSLISTWQYSHVTYFSGVAPQKIDLPEGPCTGHETDFEYVVKADAINCGGVLPCAEIRIARCIFNGAIETPSQDICDELENQLPISLLQDNFYCATNTVSINQRRNVFCITNVASIRYKAQKISYCNFERNVLSLERFINTLNFCSINPPRLNNLIQRVSFCNYNPVLIHTNIIIQKVIFCQINDAALSLANTITKVRFCSLQLIVTKVSFCSINETSLRNINSLQFCSHDITSERINVPKVQYCEHIVPVSVIYCSFNRLNIDGASNVNYCSQDGSSLNAATKVNYCEITEAHIRKNTFYCQMPRYVIDGVADIRFCSIERKNLHNVVNVRYCSINPNTF